MDDRTARIKEASIFSELLILACPVTHIRTGVLSGTPEFLAFPQPSPNKATGNLPYPKIRNCMNEPS